jgi:hypothetical protein
MPSTPAVSSAGVTTFRTRKRSRAGLWVSLVVLLLVVFGVAGFFAWRAWRAHHALW